MTYRILVTGSRAWADEDIIACALLTAVSVARSLNLEPVLVHGHCPTGADAIADAIWQRHVGMPERHPADWNTYGKAAGFKRNQQMVDLGADICIAFPRGKAAGTKHCMSAAAAAGIRVVNYESFGHSKVQ